MSSLSFLILPFVLSFFINIIIIGISLNKDCGNREKLSYCLEKTHCNKLQNVKLKSLLKDPLSD